MSADEPDEGVIGREGTGRLRATGGIGLVCGTGETVAGPYICDESGEAVGWRNAGVGRKGCLVVTEGAFPVPIPKISSLLIRPLVS